MSSVGARRLIGVLSTPSSLPSPTPIVHPLLAILSDPLQTLRIARANFNLMPAWFELGSDCKRQQAAGILQTPQPSRAFLFFADGWLELSGTGWNEVGKRVVAQTRDVPPAERERMARDLESRTAVDLRLDRHTSDHLSGRRGHLDEHGWERAGALVVP